MDVPSVSIFYDHCFYVRPPGFGRFLGQLIGHHLHSISRYLEASINLYEPQNPHSGNNLLLRVWYAGQVVMAAVVVIILEILLVARG